MSMTVDTDALRDAARGFDQVKGDFEQTLSRLDAAVKNCQDTNTFDDMAKFTQTWDQTQGVLKKLQDYLEHASSHLVSAASAWDHSFGSGA